MLRSICIVLAMVFKCRHHTFLCTQRLCIEELLLFDSIILCEIIFDFIGKIDARSAICLAAADNDSVIFRSVQPVHHGNECESNLYANECAVLCIRRRMRVDLQRCSHVGSLLCGKL